MHFASPEFVAAARTLMALVFVSASIAKVRHWSAFEGVVANYRLVPTWLVRTVSYSLPVVELLLGAALLAGIANAEWPAGGLLIVFALAMGINLARGRSHIDCGCFNTALKQPLHWSLVLRNLCLAVLLAVVAGAPGPALNSSWLLGSLSGIAAFIVFQCTNALLALPAARRPRILIGNS